MKDSRWKRSFYISYISSFLFFQIKLFYLILNITLIKKNIMIMITWPHKRFFWQLSILYLNSLVLFWRNRRLKIFLHNVNHNNFEFTLIWNHENLIFSIDHPFFSIIFTISLKNSLYCCIYDANNLNILFIESKTCHYLKRGGFFNKIII